MSDEQTLREYEIDLAKKVTNTLADDFRKKMDEAITQGNLPSKQNELAYSTMIGYITGILLFAEQLKSMRDRAKKLMIPVEVDLQKAKILDKKETKQFN